jgi:DNA-binding response OmpR family regulator
MTKLCDAACLPGGAKSSNRGVGKLIMVVEDDPGLIALYRALLAAGGYRVLTAGDGEEAVIAFERERSDIDLLIADVCLPKVGAVEMLQRMQAGGELPPVLVCSGAVECDMEGELRKVGATWFLPKPFRNREILGQIERMLDSASASRS